MARERTAALPWWVIAAAGLAIAFALVPLAALALRADPAQFPQQVTSPSSLTALWLSLRTSLAATALCLLLGLPLALLLSRLDGRIAGILRTLALLPLVLPPVIGGIALLYTFGRRGLIGQHLEAIGVQIAFTTAAVVIAQAFVALPFLVVSVEGALRSSEMREHQQAASTLGASPAAVLWLITLPLIRPALVSGTILVFARALGEFGATLAFAGSLEGATRTLPLEVYLARETDPDAAVALSFVLILVALIVMAVTGAARARPASPKVGA